MVLQGKGVLSTIQTGYYWTTYLSSTLLPAQMVCNSNKTQSTSACGYYFHAELDSLHMGVEQFCCHQWWRSLPLTGFVIKVTDSGESWKSHFPKPFSSFLGPKYLWLQQMILSISHSTPSHSLIPAPKTSRWLHSKYYDGNWNVCKMCLLFPSPWLIFGKSSSISFTCMQSHTLTMKQNWGLLDPSGVDKYFSIWQSIWLSDKHVTITPSQDTVV